MSTFRLAALCEPKSLLGLKDLKFWGLESSVFEEDSHLATHHLSRNPTPADSVSSGAAGTCTTDLHPHIHGPFLKQTKRKKALNY